MNTRLSVFLFVFVAIGATLAVPARGGESELAENAALQYWKAFAILPELSDKQHEALRKYRKQRAIGQSLHEVIKSSDSALHELRKGAKLKDCCWGISMEDGPHAMMPHLSKAQQLSRLACLRADWLFEQGKASDAVEDIAAVMTLGRHVTKDGVLVSLFVDYAIQRLAIETAAANLMSLDANQLQVLARELETLPPQPRFSDAVVAEKEMFVGWAIRVLSEPDGKNRLIAALFGDPDLIEGLDGGSGNPAERRGSDPAQDIRKSSPEELLAAAKQLQGFYDRLAEAVVAMPPDKAKQTVERLMAQPGMEGPAREMALRLVPAIGAARRIEAVLQTRLALLEAAIAVRQHGPDVLEKDDYRDPFGAGPFKHAETGNGFQLRSTLTDIQDQPVSLTIGRP